MENYRLKVKFGQYEFDAEGPPDVVQAQFVAFQEMVAKLPTLAAQASAVQAPTPPAHVQTEEPAPENNGGSQATAKLDAAGTDASLSKIMKVENRIVSLTARPPTAEDAALLLLYGQRMLRNNDACTGSELVDGLERTGGIDIGRSERLFERISRSGDILTTGERRAKRYRLTNAGVNKARQIAANLIALVAF